MVVGGGANSSGGAAIGSGAGTGLGATLDAPGTAAASGGEAAWTNATESQTGGADTSGAAGLGSSATGSSLVGDNAGGGAPVGGHSGEGAAARESTSSETTVGRPGGASGTGGNGGGAATEGRPSGGIEGGGRTIGNGGAGGNTSGAAATGGGTHSGGDTGEGDASGGAAGGAASTAGEGGTATGGHGNGGDPTAAGSSSQSPVTWPLINGVQWADTGGEPIQAHGGGVLKAGDDYFWFGENRNPDGTFYAVSAYRSRDLHRWEHIHDVLTMDSDPGLSPANVERPKVVYNANTGRYVMWMHWENGRDYGEARAAVASSDTVTGDYTYHGSFRPLQDTGVRDHDKPGYMSRDCTLFVDDDGTGYFLSASNENYDLHLYLLSDDYLSIVRREALLFEGGHREAPALFKRQGTYFLLTSGATGWDPNQAKYATSSSLSSGWSSMQNVADGNTFYSQSTYVLPVQGRQGTDYLYLGDRWAGAWGGRVNESTYVWQPIDFPTATSMSMSWANTIRVESDAGTVSGAVDTFQFINAKSGLLLAVNGPAGENGSDLVQQAQGSASTSAWRFNYDGAGYFRLTNDASGKVIDVPDEAEEAGVHLHLWDDNGGDHQAWLLEDLGEGKYRVRNKKSGLYVGVLGGSMEVAATVEQQTRSEGEEQIWAIVVAD